MRLSSQNSQFVFSLSHVFVPKELEAKYKPFLDKIHCQYDSVLDYVNSTIKSIVFPGVTYQVVEQTHLRGKKNNFKGSMNIWDNFNRDIEIVFKSVDSNINYLMIMDICNWWYLNVDQKQIHVPPIIMAILDWNRDAVFYLKFDHIVIKDINSITFNYSDQSVEEKTFSVSFAYNWFDVEYIFLKENWFRNIPISNNLELAIDNTFRERDISRIQYKTP